MGTHHVASALSANETSDWVQAHAALSRLARERAVLDAEEGRWLLRAWRSAAHVHLGYGSFAQYVESLFGYKSRTTQEKLRVAEALEALPGIAHALEGGATELVRRITGQATPMWARRAHARKPPLPKRSPAPPTRSCQSEPRGPTPIRARAPNRASRQRCAAPCARAIGAVAALRAAPTRRSSTCIIQPRAEGGRNEACNLLTLCRSHHRAVHRGELLIEHEPDGALVFRHADGAAYGNPIDPRIIDAHAKVFSALRQLGFRERQPPALGKPKLIHRQRLCGHRRRTSSGAR